jgi:hypothetical protein
MTLTRPARRHRRGARREDPLPTRSPLLIAGLVLPALLLVVGPGHSQTRPIEVAVAPFLVEKDSAGAVRAVADKCLAALVAGLKAKGVVVAEHAQLSEKQLDAARPALVAVLGRFTREGGQYSGELRLLEVQFGEELRSYFINDKDPGAIAKSCEAAAGRIAGAVKELEERPPGE